MKFITLLAATAGLAASASAQVFSSSPNLPIRDFETTSDTITVSGGPASIVDLNVNLQLTHTYDADIGIALQGPNGYISLSTRSGDSGNNYLTTRFDDASSLNISSGDAPFNADFRPEGILTDWTGPLDIFFGTNFNSLAGFNRSNANGQWTLIITDGAPGDEGSLLYWSLEFNYASDPANPRPAPAPPAIPTGRGSILPPVVTDGQSINLRVAVTPAFNPLSSGVAVTVDAAALGLGNLQLLDDGFNDDGIPGNDVFGLNNIPVSGLGEGSYPLVFIVSDEQGRSSVDTFPLLTIAPAAPGCPGFLDAQSFSNLNAAGPAQVDPANSTQTLTFGGFNTITDLHISGRLISARSGSRPNQTGIALNFSDGSSEFFNPFDDFNTFDYVDANDLTLTLNNPRPAGDVVGFEVYDFNDDPGVDATWSTLCISYEARESQPRIDGAFALPQFASPGDTVQLFATAVRGFNPTSTGFAVIADVSSLGGDVLAPLSDDGDHLDGAPGDGFYGGSVFIPQGIAPGTYTIRVDAADDQDRVVSFPIDIRVAGPIQWDEAANGGGDAGELPGSAQTVAGAGPLTSIGGIVEDQGTDMFLINICDPANFSASTNDPRTPIDTQLWLFNPDGTGVEHNDDGPDGGSFLDNSFVSQPGLYLLAITNYNRDAQDANEDLIWANSFFSNTRAPDGPGAANPIAFWGGRAFDFGPYVINLTGTCLVGASCDPDVNQDGNSDQGDIDYLINVVAGGDNPTNIDPDFNRDGNVDQGDIDALLNVVAGGNCP